MKRRKPKRKNAAETIG